MRRFLLSFTFTLFSIVCIGQESLWTSDFSIKDIPLANEMSHVFYYKSPTSVKMGNAKSWIAKTFGDYKSVLQLEDADNNRIIIKAGTPIQYSLNHLESKYNPKTFFFAEQYVFTMTMDFKEDRYRIRFENISILNASESKDGILQQEYIVPNNEVSLETRFGENLNTDYVSESALDFKKAFLKLYNSASKAIETVDEF